MTDPYASIRQAVNGLQPLSENEWNDFSEKLTIKTFAKGHFLIQAGQTENHVYFINSGATRNYFSREDKEYTVDFHFSGEFVTAYYSLITREPSTINIELLESSEVVTIAYKDLQEFYNRHHHGERIGRLIAEYQYVKRLRKEMDLLALRAEERYAQLMQRNPSLIQTLSVKHVSSYLGIQPESLSRIRKLYAKN
jgi:CRP-like cAMP-binding protein